jgi:hypothetical protein
LVRKALYIRDNLALLTYQFFNLPTTKYTLYEKYGNIKEF